MVLVQQGFSAGFFSRVGGSPPLSDVLYGPVGQVHLNVRCGLALLAAWVGFLRWRTGLLALCSVVPPLLPPSFLWCVGWFVCLALLPE